MLADGEPLAIHAALTTLRAIARRAPGVESLFTSPALLHALKSAGLELETLPRGGLICVVKPVETLRTEDALRLGKISEVEYQFGDYARGRFCTRLEVTKVLPRKLPCTGRQKYFNVPDLGA